VRRSRFAGFALTGKGGEEDEGEQEGVWGGKRKIASGGDPERQAGDEWCSQGREKQSRIGIYRAMKWETD
jgi:hypothetical protein